MGRQARAQEAQRMLYASFDRVSLFIAKPSGGTAEGGVGHPK